MVKQISNKLSYEQNDNVLRLDIMTEYSIDEYNKNISEYQNLRVPLYLIITNPLKDKVVKQTIFIIKLDQEIYYIFKSNNQLKISKLKKINKQVIETTFTLNIDNNDYTLSKYFYGFNRKFKQNIANSRINLNKKVSIKSLQRLLEQVSIVNKDYNILDMNKLYDAVNLVSDSNYRPLISDEVLTISWPHSENGENIDLCDYGDLDIILNETREKIGNISFDYLCCSGFTYGGNVSYDICEQFRHKHYATRALKLLKELLIKNKYKGDKDLYIAALYENIYSQKVALNNDGKLVYAGLVPEYDPLYFFQGVEKVFVYKIKL
jgi:hypothetical protein